MRWIRQRGGFDGHGCAAGLGQAGRFESGSKAGSGGPAPLPPFAGLGDGLAAGFFLGDLEFCQDVEVVGKVPIQNSR